MTTTTPVGDQLGLGPIGIVLDVSADGQHLRDAAEAEELGYSTLWLAGGQLDRLELIADVLAATSRVSVAPGIIPVDVYSSDDVARFHRDLPPDQRDRFVVGLGGPQAPRPMRALGEYLDRLDRADPPVPAHRRILAALGPRKLELSRDRAAGAVPLLVTPEYTADARRILGAESVLAINQLIVLDSDGQRARELARTPLRFLAQVPGYRAAFLRMGLSDNDVDELSDRLVDALVSWGDAETVAARVREHRAAGADHVVISPINAEGAPRSMDGPRQLARLLIG